MTTKTRIVTVVASLGIVLFLLGSYFYSEKNEIKAVPNNNGIEIAKDGDVIFQTSESSQCEAVRIATRSKFSHCGIIFTKDNEKFVLEAVQPVKITPLKEWIQHGKDNCYMIKRVKDTLLLDNQKRTAMRLEGTKQLNKDYDLYFEWNDDKIYCSELVWKIYQRGANITLCKEQLLQSFNLKDPKVKAILKQRYGKNIPLREKVVAPSQLAESTLLETVFDNYTF